MPGEDRTGPMGMSPITGRATGFYAGSRRGYPGGRRFDIDTGMENPGKMIQVGLLRFGASTAGRFLSKPTVRSTIRGFIRKLTTGSKERPFREIASVEQASERVVEILKGRIPDQACIGIDGIAGSGKSTLGRSLSPKLGLELRTLHTREMNKPVELRKGTVYENIRLFRTQEIEHCDAILYLDVPVEVARHRVLERDRNGVVLDFLDFEKLKRIGNLAFELADGEVIEIPESPIRIKVRPLGGYRIEENLASRMKSAGIQAENLSKEEMLFLFVYGEARRGIRPYLKLGTYNRDFMYGFLDALENISQA